MRTLTAIEADRRIHRASQVPVNVEEVVRMPNNPFPPDSAWGRKLDEMYRNDITLFRSYREISK